MDRTPPPPYADLPIPALVAQLSQDTATLIRDEMRLARAEIAEAGKKASASAGLFGVTVLGGLGAFFAFTYFLIALIALALPQWAAALIVAVLYAVVAGVAALSGKKAVEKVGNPIEGSVESVKADASAVAAGVRRGR